MKMPLVFGKNLRQKPEFTFSLSYDRIISEKVFFVQ